MKHQVGDKSLLLVKLLYRKEVDLKDAVQGLFCYVDFRGPTELMVGKMYGRGESGQSLPSLSWDSILGSSAGFKDFLIGWFCFFSSFVKGD